VEGFAGLRVINNKLSLTPTIPSQWKYYEFRIIFRGIKLDVRIEQSIVNISNLSDIKLELELQSELYLIEPNKTIAIPINQKKTKAL